LINISIVNKSNNIKIKLIQTRFNNIFDILKQLRINIKFKYNFNYFSFFNKLDKSAFLFDFEYKFCYFLETISINFYIIFIKDNLKVQHVVKNFATNLIIKKRKSLATK